MSADGILRPARRVVLGLDFRFPEDPRSDDELAAFIRGTVSVSLAGQAFAKSAAVTVSPAPHIG